LIFLHKSGEAVETFGPEALVVASQSIACSIGLAVKWHATVRPVFARATRPASDSTSRCFMIAGNDIANGCARSLTDILS
jgi:hypothetical protein